MSHHSPSADAAVRDELLSKLAEAHKPLGSTGEHPRGRLTPTDEGGIRIAIGERNGAVVIDFGTPVAWVGFSAAEARQLAESLVKHADHIEVARDKYERNLEPARVDSDEDER